LAASSGHCAFNDAEELSEDDIDSMLWDVNVVPVDESKTVTIATTDIVDEMFNEDDEDDEEGDDK
jgi:hypothetical protein